MYQSESKMPSDQELEEEMFRYRRTASEFMLVYEVMQGMTEEMAERAARMLEGLSPEEVAERMQGAKLEALRTLESLVKKTGTSRLQ
mgnify:CR=1 FL=1